VSARATGWAWGLDLLPQRKLLLLWLANRATDQGVCYPSKREIAAQVGLGERMTRYHLAWLASERDEHGRPKQPLLDVIERPVDGQRSTSNVYVLRVPWADPAAVRAELQELQHVPAAALERVGAAAHTQRGGGTALHPLGAAGDAQVRASGCTRKGSPGDHHRQPSPPDPPTGPPRPQEVVEALYRGLGADLGQLTPALRRRELAIAAQLVAVGATPAEAEAYARDARAQPGRFAAVDLRAFERERLAWLARRRGAETSLARHVDRTGQPPGGVQAGALARRLFGDGSP
jgi:Helix-turn-helix domain